jgi:hypothetical protein
MARPQDVGLKNSRNDISGTRPGVRELCIILTILGTTMFPLDRIFGIWPLIAATFALILLLLRMNKYQRDTAARVRMHELTRPFIEQNRSHD